MASTETKTVTDAGSVEAGLDALEVAAAGRTPFRQTFTAKILPPVIATVVVLIVWQALISFKIDRKSVV